MRFKKSLNGFSKATGYKINIETSVAFLYINDSLSEKCKGNPIYGRIKTKITKSKFN